MQITDYIQFSNNSLEKFEKELTKKTFSAKPFLTRYYTTIPTASYQYISEIVFSVLKSTENPLEKALCKWFLTNVEKLEAAHAMSGLVCFKLMLAAIKETQKLPPEFQKSRLKTLWNNEFFNALFFKIRKPLTKKNLDDLLSEWTQGKETFAEALKIAIDIAGMEGNITVEENTTQQTNHFVIEAKNGYEFKNLEVPVSSFITQTKAWEFSNVKVLCVDGFIDKVSEIDKLLQKSFETKQPMIIFALGYHEEVMSTILLNTAQKRFNILPVKIPSSLSGLNVNNDISTVSNTKLVSVVNGDMLTLVNYDDLAAVEKVTATPTSILISNSTITKNVKNHVTTLIEKRGRNNNIVDISALYDDRIRSLSTNNVILKQAKQKTGIGVRIDVDNILRLIRSTTRYGFIKVSDLKNELEKPETEDSFTVRIIKNAFNDINDINSIPITSIIFAGKIFQEGIISFLSCSGIVYAK